MKSTRLISLAASIAAITACQGIETESTGPVLVTREFTAIQDSGTRTGMDGMKILWDTSGETIDIIDASGNVYTLEQTSVSEDRKTASFRGEVPETGCEYAVYPSGAFKGLSGGVPTIEIPSVQQATVGSFASHTNPAVAKLGEGDKMMFRNLCAVVGITVNAKDIASVRMSAKEAKGGRISGPGPVTFADGIPASGSVSTNNPDVVELTGGLQSGKQYWMLIRPGSYSDITFVFTATDGRTASFASGKVLEIERSHARNISPFTITDDDWDEQEKAGTATLTFAETSGVSYGYDSPKTYTNSYGTWIISAYKGNSMQLNAPSSKRNKVYIGTPEFEEPIRSVTLTRSVSLERTGNVYLCTSPTNGSIPTPNVSKTLAKNAESITLDATPLGARQLYICADFMFCVETVTVEWSSSSDPLPEPEPTVRTLPATAVGVAQATLNASFDNIPVDPDPTAAFFRWGTSATALGQTAYDNQTILDSAKGSFSATIGSLEEATTYYYQAVMTLADGSDVEGEVLSFKTLSSGAATDLGYLNCYEAPAIDISGYMADGNENSGRGYKWYRFDTTNPKRKVVTHTFKNSGKQTRNMTVMVDGDNKAPYWTAFIMHKDVFPNNSLGRGSWTSDPAFPSDWQHDITLGNYHRGHLVASNYRQNVTDARNQTFYSTNQAPQYQTQFNDGIWNNMEQKIAGYAPTGRDTLYLTVGVLYEGTIQKIQGIPIPSHFYTCLMYCSFNTSGIMTSARGCAYIFENRPYTQKEGYDDYTIVNGVKEYDYICTIDEIEERAGFDFYHNVPDDFEAAAESGKVPIW